MGPRPQVKVWYYVSGELTLTLYWTLSITNEQLNSWTACIYTLPDSQWTFLIESRHLPGLKQHKALGDESITIEMMCNDNEIDFLYELFSQYFW